ncbi:T9SS type B sorting domain-containing protein [Chryseobacterium scophthalmum]|uniref:T9SS type B sorting domain-containing protein n=1 Tax=Chryseobacterium scophthalmum TaxID=59733 RepID=UPI001AEC5D71|nr:T9SS type B sorting domain-containing protein [Chryseobacterium scophthalmum]
MKKMLLLFLFIFSINTFAQRDTEHWIAPYYTSVQTYSNGLYLSTDSVTPFEVQVFNNNILINTLTISKGNPQSFVVPQNLIEGSNPNLDAFKVISKGLYLKGTKPFYCTLRPANGQHGEIITSKGKAGIGKLFYVASSPNDPDNVKDNFTAGILATEDNTMITVSWAAPGIEFVGGAATGNSHTFTLNKGQSFIFVGEIDLFNTNNNATGFIGAKVVSDKPVSLTNGSANGNFAAPPFVVGSDPILDQSVPVERLGNTFAMVKTKSTFPQSNMEGGIVIATENNTQIFINGATTPVATINEGEWFRINETNYFQQTPGSGHFNMFVSASKNVYLYQFVGVGNFSYTGGFNYIPPLNCFLPRKIDEIGKINEMPNIPIPISLKLNIITESGAAVTVNGVTPTAAQGPFPLTGNTQWETYAIEGITGNVTVTSTKAVTAGVNGGYSTAGYGGYFAGFSSVPVISKTGDCVPGIILQVDDHYDTYQWFLNGNPVPGATSPTFTPIVAGNYTVRVTAGTCAPVITPIFKVFSCDHKSTKNFTICSGPVSITPSFTVSTQTYVPTTLVIVTPPNNGTTSITNGIITYTPNAGFVGNDTFVYRFCGNAPEFVDCEEVTVNLTISQQLTVQNAVLTQCSNLFDLTTAEPNISTAPGISFDYYENQADALAGNTNTITTPTSYTPGSTIVFVRVESGTCFSIAELQLNIVQAPAPVITSSSPTICAGGNVTLSSNQATGNTWSTGEITQSITITAPGTYTLTTNNGACNTSASITITQDVDPNIQVTGNLTFCPGSNTVLTATAAGTGNTFVWSNGTNGPTNTVAAPGTYTVTVTTPANCQYQQSVNVVQSIDPNVQITGNLTFCPGSNTVLTATATGTGNTFVWSNGTNGPTNTVAVPGNHTVTVTTPDGCQYQQSVTVIMNTAIIVNIVAPAEITCITQQITLNATASVFEPGATFLWTAAAAGNIVTGANTLTPTVNSGGIYTLTITSEAGCPQQATVTVIENITPPVIALTAPKLIICKGESVVLTANGAITYNWATLPGNGNTQTVSPTSTTTYTVEGVSVSANGCKANTTITIEVVPEIASTLQDVEICEGDRTILDAGAGTNYTYLWNTGETTQTISVEQAGVYTVTINNGTCTKTVTATISYIVAPEISEVVYNDNTLTINVKNSGVTVLEYSIDDGITWQTLNVFFNVLKNTQYIIRVRNKGAMCDTTTTYYTFFMVNTITPNGDGRNDTINFTTVSGFKDFEGEIFDRYGRVIFRINATNPIWNGKELGRVIPTATYWYKLSWTDSISKKTIRASGWILLKNRNN